MLRTWLYFPASAERTLSRIRINMANGRVIAWIFQTGHMGAVSLKRARLLRLRHRGQDALDRPHQRTNLPTLAERNHRPTFAACVLRGHLNRRRLHPNTSQVLLATLGRVTTGGRDFCATRLEREPQQVDTISR